MPLSENMPMWSLSKLLDELVDRGHQIVDITQEGHVALRSPVSRLPVLPLVTFPVGNGDRLPDRLVRHNLRDEGLNLDELAAAVDAR